MRSPLEPPTIYILRHREFGSYFGPAPTNTFDCPGTVESREDARLFTGAELESGVASWEDVWEAVEAMTPALTGKES